MLRLCHTDIPDMGMLCDFLWSDPDADLQGWGENDRGVSYTYGTDVVADFLAKFDFDLVVRAHQARPYPIAFFQLSTLSRPSSFVL